MMLIDGSVILCMSEFLRKEYVRALRKGVHANVGFERRAEAIEDAGEHLLQRFCDEDMLAHAHRLAILCEMIGIYLKLSKRDVFRLRMSALFHDIGKLAVPAPILHKPAALDPHEKACMQLHPQLGQRMLTLAGSDFALFAPIIVAHHECWDGRGYPLGLSKEEIPFLTRILTVVDAYDAMVSRRVYGQPQPAAQAHQELLRCANYQFDPFMVHAFITVFGSRHTQHVAFSDLRTFLPDSVHYAKSRSRWTCTG